jgi:hypothetical protein
MWEVQTKFSGSKWFKMILSSSSFVWKSYKFYCTAPMRWLDLQSSLKIGVFVVAAEKASHILRMMYLRLICCTRHGRHLPWSVCPKFDLFQNLAWPPCPDLAMAKFLVRPACVIRPKYWSMSLVWKIYIPQFLGNLCLAVSAIFNLNMQIIFTYY